MRPTTRVALLAVLAIVLAHLGDGYAYQHLAKDGVLDADFGRMLRIVGYLPLWLLLAVAAWLQTKDRRTALLIGGMPTLGGLVAEVFKIVLRRERPKLHEGEYFFRPYADHFWSTRDIGLPSSHALVAFSGAWILCRVYPKAWPVWLGLAAGCALTRVQAQAHFLSDVTVAAVVAYGMVAWCWGRWGSGTVSS